MTEESEPRRLRLIYTGGTIGCTGEPLAPMPAAAFQALWQSEIAPELPERCETSWTWLDPALDSSEMAPGDWARLTELVLAAASEGADGVVLLHGTDTMANSAAALAMLTTRIDPEGRAISRLALPVVLTGAQRPLFAAGGVAAGTDGRRNAIDACRAALSGAPGIRVTFAGQSLPAARVMKQSSIDDAAFFCPNGTCEVDPLAPCPPDALHAQLQALAPFLGCFAVPVFAPAPNAPELQACMLDGLTTALGDRLGALLLAGYGIGTMPAAPHLGPLLEAIVARNVSVAVVSQAPEGGVVPGLYVAGSWLDRLGVLPAGDMTLAAAQAKLHLGCALAGLHGWDREAFARFFLAPIAGEITR